MQAADNGGMKISELIWHVGEVVFACGIYFGMVRGKLDRLVKDIEKLIAFQLEAVKTDTTSVGDIKALDARLEVCEDRLDTYAEGLRGVEKDVKGVEIKVAKLGA